MQSTLTLSLYRTRLGTQNEWQFMQVQVTDPAGASVLIDFSFEPYNDSIMCIGPADMLQGVYSGSHLCALVGSFLWDSMTPDMEFLYEPFFSDGKQIDLKMPQPVPAYAGI